MKYLFLLVFVLGVVYNSFLDISLWALGLSMFSALVFVLLEYKLDE